MLTHSATQTKNVWTKVTLGVFIPNACFPNALIPTMYLSRKSISWILLPRDHSRSSHSRKVYPWSSAFEGVSRFRIAIFGIMTGRDRRSLGNMYSGKRRSVDFGLNWVITYTFILKVSTLLLTLLCDVWDVTVTSLMEGSRISWNV